MGGTGDQERILKGRNDGPNLTSKYHAIPGLQVSKGRHT